MQPTISIQDAIKMADKAFKMHLSERDWIELSAVGYGPMLQRLRNGHRTQTGYDSAALAAYLEACLNKGGITFENGRSAIC